MKSLSAISCLLSIISITSATICYQNAGPLTPEVGSAALGYVDIEESISISMDIEIHSFSSGWSNIFLIGADLDRQPGIWINSASATSTGFHVSFYDGNVNPIFNVGGALQTDTVYHVEIYYDQSGVIVSANGQTLRHPGKVRFPNYPRHLFQDDQPIYIGQPDHYPASDATVTNLVIDCQPSNEEIIPLDCTQRLGDKLYTEGSVSKAKCNARETLVSCGINGWHNIGGTRIRPSRDNICQAVLSADESYGVQAVANCCRFPKNANAFMFATLSDPGEEVTASCGKKSELTGCSVSYKSGSINNIKGSYAGKGFRKDERKTRNTCTGQARSSATNVQAGAQCIKVDEDKGYNLDCVAVSKYTTKYGLTESNSCPTDYQLISCMTYSTTYTLDDWYVTSNGGVTSCYIQQDGWKEMYANGICCQLTKTKYRYEEEEWY